ncbi:MAG: 5'/3'-nucleotidase SurE [Chloroflexota bacterium]
MRILVTNDDGILAAGLWALVGELKRVAEVVVVAPDREQSARGTAVTLGQPLRVQRVEPAVPGVASYSIAGTPADSVIMALGRVVGDNIDLVVSGINHGSNLGEDVFISGTVAAALQGYLHGFPAVAISVDAYVGPYLDVAARLAALLAREIGAGVIPVEALLNINLPNRPLAEIKGARVTRLAHKSHINAVEAGGGDRGEYYRLVRQRLNNTDDRIPMSGR